MSVLFDRLKQVFEDGHRKEVSGLRSDEEFARGKRTADAAVLIAVTERERPGVILTRRPDTMRDHPGQVAFPGGKIDAGEDAVQAALREADEELALPRPEVQIIGTTDPYMTGTGFNVTPVLGVIPPDLPLVPNPGEVESWFETPLDILLDEDSWTEHHAQWRGDKRSYLLMDWEDYRIWGVTAAIIANLSRRLDRMRLFDD